MKGYTLLFTLCISSLAVCNAQRSHSVELKTRSIFGHDKIIRKDRIPARSSSSDQPQEVPVTNNLLTSFPTVDIGVGDGRYSVVIDTRFSNTWVGANMSNPYRPSNSSCNTGQNVSNAGYIFGSFGGKEFIDTVELPGISQKIMQSIGSANFTDTDGFDGVDGVLGIGMPLQTVGTLSPNETEVIPTIMDNIIKNDLVQKNIIGILIMPLATNTSGRLDLGGINPDGVTSEVKFVPNTNVPGINESWALDVSITLGEGNDEVTLVEGGHCVIDAAWALTSLPTPAFNKYANLVGGEIDEFTTFLTVNDSSRLQSMFFHIGGDIYEFPPDAQIWPRMLTKVDSNLTYLFIGDAGSNDCVFGRSWLERRYVVLDNDNLRIGIADTNFTRAVLNDQD